MTTFRSNNIRKSTERGHVSHGWLDSYFSFSFAEYYDPAHIQFGPLRVINDDTIAPNSGFGMHPHRDMEIITIPLSGEIEHEDSMGNISRIGPGQIQVMSAGTGIFHSERNPSQTNPVKLLQIWVHPNKRGVVPRYEEMSYFPLQKNSFTPLIRPLVHPSEQKQVAPVISPKTPSLTGKTLGMYQNVWFFLGDFEAGSSTNYQISTREVDLDVSHQNGLYIFVIEGHISVNSVELYSRDAIEILPESAKEIFIEMITDSRILLIDV